LTWVVVGLAVFDAWAEAIDDSEVRIQVLEWMVGLQEDGPPANGVFDPFRETWSAMVPGTTVTAEYIVAPFLDPPAIAVRRLS
jgi:hypothetical protein